MQFVQLILRKIIKIVATRCQILRLKCTKFDFGPRWGSLQRSPDPLAGFDGSTSKGGKGLRGEGTEEKAGEGRREGRRGEGRGGRRREGRGGLSGNVAEEAFYLKSAPGQIQKQHFSRFMVLFDYLAYRLQETVLPQTNGTDGKPRL